MEVKFPLLERIELRLENTHPMLELFLKVFVTEGLFPNLRSIGFSTVAFTFDNKIDLTSFILSEGFTRPFLGNPNVERINMNQDFNV